MTQMALARSKVLFDEHLEKLLFLGSGQKGPQKAKIRDIL